MNYKDLPTYSEILAKLEKNKRKKHLLFGNGFSIAYNHTIFSYNALSKFIEDNGNNAVKGLFKTLNTTNFELIMRQLETFSKVAHIFSDDKKTQEKINVVISELKKSLIDAVTKLHPKHVFEVPENKSKACIKFLEEYLSKEGFVFSTNYDLLFYWILMRNKSKYIIDGFGRDLETDLYHKKEENDELDYSELRWGKYSKEQNVFYLHGSLPIFDDGINVVKVQYDNEHYLLENVKERITKGEYPVFVTAGDGNQKLNQITHNKYLNFCLEKLMNIEGSLVTFGFNFGEYDEHIIEAINIAAKRGKRSGEKLHSVYIGVYSEQDYNHILSITDKFQCKVNIYDAKTANIWN
ncbi:DUF4917 family protein [Riemerella anatipestifer]|uniref:DUF4917 family protein n=1 Tax=Riemerella anatipestifer TaxID=34085 RepID=UPI002A88F5D9|nr:DUF4917 family protein [Riemerella anatipestifer]